MANFKITEGIKEELNNTPFVDGQVLMELDEENSKCYMYLDTLDENNELKRVLMGSRTELKQYTITYNGNGATGGEVDSQTKYKDEPIELRENEFYKTDYNFKEWNTQSNGQGVSYDEGDIYTTNADLSLYAIWESTAPQPEEYIIVAFHNNDNYDISSPYYFDKTLAQGYGMNVGTEITYGKLHDVPAYGAITTNYYVDGGGRTLRTFGFYVSKDPDGVENTDNIHSSDVISIGSFTITNNITGETETWYVSVNMFTIEGDYSSVSNPYFDSSSLISEVNGVQGYKDLGEAFLLAIGQDNKGDFDIIGLSDVPFQSIIGDNVQETIAYAGNTYYYYNRLNRDYNDYISYNFNLYTNNTYTLRDANSRGELAYIIFDGNDITNEGFTHDINQYITGIFNQPIWGKENNTFFRYHLRSDWQTEESNYDDITLSYKNFTSPVYIIFLQSTTSTKGFNGYYMVSENSFVGHVHKERYFADGSSYGVQDWDSNPYTVTRNNITYYVSDIYQGSNITLNEYVTNCDLKYTPTTIQGQSWSDDQRWELAYIVLDGVRSSSIDYVTHVKDSYITGIWNEPIPINHYIVDNSLLTTPLNNRRLLLNNASPKKLSAPILTSSNDNELIANKIKVQSNNGEIQIYNPLRDEWFNLFSCVSKEQIIELNNGDIPTFVFDVLDIKYPQKMEIYSSINELHPNKITYTTVAEDIPKTMTVEFEPFISSEIPSHSDDKIMTCKIYFYSPKQNLVDVDEWEEVPFDLPYDCYGAAACVYNDRLHILGGVNNPTKHFSWDGVINSWREESTLPYECNDCAAISYKGAIHIMGGVNNYNKHYSWTGGNTWVQQTDLPIHFCGKDKVVIYQDKLRLVSSGYSYYSQFRYICTWTDPTSTEAGSWTTLDIGTNNSWGQSEVINNMIYMMSASGDGRSCRIYDGTTFDTGVALSSNYYGDGATSVVYNNKIHLIGVGNNQGTNTNKHLKFDGTTWTEMNTTPCSMNGSTSVVFKNRIYVLGNLAQDKVLKMYKWKGLER